MTCAACGAALPASALFCGECGRAVTSATPVPAPAGARPMAISAPPPSPEDGVPSVAEVPPCAECGAELQPGDLFCGECGLVTPAAASATPGPVVRATTDAATPVRFVLQFSTGESHTVAGTGLVGRNPRPEPGEAFDRLIMVTDPTRSVSKTHLEFGQDDGVFWVSDRFSGNGTSVREPGESAQLVTPGRRRHIARGTRVDMGEQFFVVS